MAKVFTLPNGVRCVHEHRPGTGKTSFEVVFKLGAAHEAADENGLTSLMEGLCAAGTTTRTREEIAEDFESGGGDFGSSTGLEMTSFSAVTLAENAEKVFASLADVIKNPVFDSVEVEKDKKQIVEIIAGQKQQPAKRANKDFYTAAYGVQAHGRPPLGEESLVGSFTPGQVKAKHADLLGDPENTVISIVGDMDFATAQKLANQHFADLKKTKPFPSVKSTFAGQQNVTATPNDQLNLFFGFEAPSYKDASYYDFVMLQEVLSGGMSTPLFQEVREKRGLVYTVSANYAAYENGGFFRVYAGTGKGQVEKLMPVAFDVIGDVAKNAVTQQQVDEARARIINSVKSSQENMDKTASRHATQILKRGKLQSMEELEAQLKDITPEHLQAAAIRMMASKVCAFSGVGPLDGVPSGHDLIKMMKSQMNGVITPKLPPRKAKTHQSATFNAQAKKTIQAGDAKITTLPNGLRVVTAAREGSLTMGIWVRVGSGNETAEQNGASHMLEHEVFKGTKSYAAGEIDQIIEGELAGGLNAYTSHDVTAYYFYGLDISALEKTLDIAGEMVFDAVFDPEEFDGKQIKQADGSIKKEKGERDVVLEELARSNDSVQDLMWRQLSTLAYPGQAHGREILGTEERLKAFTVELLRDYRDAFYVPNNMTVVASGPVDHEAFVKLVEQKLGQKQAGPVTELPTPVYHGGTAHREAETAERSISCLGFKGVPASHDDEVVYELLEIILAGGESSRLVKKIVDELELAPGIGVFQDNYRKSGMFNFITQAKAKNLKPLLAAVVTELKRLPGSLSEAELTKAKTQMKMAIIDGLETNHSACEFYGRASVSEDTPPTRKELLDKVNKVTAQDIGRVVGDLLSSNPTLSMVVPQGTAPAHIPDHNWIVSEIKKPAASAKPAPKFQKKA